MLNEKNDYCQAKNTGKKKTFFFPVFLVFPGKSMTWNHGLHVAC